MDRYKDRTPNYSQNKLPKGFKLKTDVTPAPGKYNPEINKTGKREVSPSWNFKQEKK